MEGRIPMIPSKKSLARFVTTWIIYSVAFIALVTLLANLYISDRHHKNSEHMAKQLQQLVDIQILNNSLNKLVSDYRGYLAFGREEFYDSSLKDKLTFDQELSNYESRQSSISKDGYVLEDNTQSTAIIKKLWNQYDRLIETAFLLKRNGEQEIADELSRSQTTPVINEIYEE